MANQGVELMADIIALIEQHWVDSEAVCAIADSMDLAVSVLRIRFLHQLHNLIRQIPVDVFNDAEQRQNLLRAVQTALNDAIDQEEEQAWQDELD